MLNKIGAKRLSYLGALLQKWENTGGEGLQIGEGEIDFYSLGEILKNECPNVPFIPEIWQGHENNGEGFWTAFEKLEKTI